MICIGISSQGGLFPTFLHSTYFSIFILSLAGGKFCDFINYL